MGINIFIMDNLYKRLSFLVIFIVVFLFSTSRCDDTDNVTEVKSQGSCTNLAECIQQGVQKGLNDIENSEVYSMLGKRLILEKTGPQETKDGAKTGLIQRAYRLLDNHVVRLRLSKSLSLTLFRTPQGPFDLALEVGEATTRGDGRTFFKHRLRMALLPIMYKLGVVTTLMGALVIMMAKTLFIGVLLLMFAVAAAVKSKLLFGHQQHGWSGPVAYSHHTPPHDIHVHVHGLQKEPYIHRDYTTATAGGSEAYHGPYSRAAHGITS